MNEENRNQEKEVDVSSAGYRMGTVIGHVIAACIVSLIVVLTIRLGSWILGF